MGNNHISMFKAYITFHMNYRKVHTGKSKAIAWWKKNFYKESIRKKEGKEKETADREQGGKKEKLLRKLGKMEG